MNVAIGLLSALSLFNLLLLFGVIRRLRQLSESARQPARLAVGDTIDDFSAVTTRNKMVTAGSLQDGTVVAFMSPTCEPCKEILPTYMEFASSSQTPTLTVMLTTDADAVEDLGRLESVGDVAVEPVQGAISTAFGVTSTPTFITVVSGKIADFGLPQVTEGALG
ncbi:thioredoxin family protein [Nonomuraea sp. NPDC003560]|uniref:thioredoxin family protein n=1 Tax=Nonomuraea sp. NPDC003560 TaxID=3364341 RepID=UPI00367CF395